MALARAPPQNERVWGVSLVRGQCPGTRLGCVLNSSDHHMIVKIMSTHREKRFFDACEAGEFEKIRNLITEGVNPKKIVTPDFKETPLHVACRYHYL